MAASQLAMLRRKFGNHCHYCGEQCTTKINSPRQGTREHVVPRAYGGANHLENYVLACTQCNNERGVSLFFCMCEYICGPLIDNAMKKETFVKRVFDGVIEYNRSRVYKNEEGFWCTQFRHGRKHHSSWQDAMDYVLSLYPEREKEDNNGLSDPRG